MAKKSFLGRLFGKKQPDSRREQKDVKAQGSAAGGTATLTKKGGPPPAPGTRDRASADAAAMRGPGPAKNSPTLVAEKPKSPGSARTDVKPDPKEKTIKAVEPEILDKSVQVAAESREKIDVIAKKMSAQEEATIKISDGIKGLSSILSNIDQRLEEQTQQSYEMVRTVNKIPEYMKDLPESSRAGVELLQAISQVLENQSRATAELGSKISGLPEVLGHLGEKIDRDAQERHEEREAHHKEREAYKESVEVVKTSMKHLEQRHQDLSTQQQENTKKLVQSVRLIQSDYQNQVNRLVDKNRMTNRLILLLIFIIAAGMITIITFLAQ